MEEYSLPTEVDSSASIWHRVFRHIVVALLVIVTTVTMAVSVMMFRRIGQTSEVAAASKRHSKFDQDRYKDLDTLRLIRCGLLEVDQQAEDIWKNIALLEKEIDAYKRQFTKLNTTAAGSKLIKDSWTVRYFVDKHGEPLSSDAVARNQRAMLNELMLTIRDSLDHPETGYDVSRGTQGIIDQIEATVTRAKAEYTDHHLLLIALEEIIAGGKPVTPETLEDAARNLQYERALIKYGHPLAKQISGQKSREKSLDDDEISKRVDNEANRSKSSKLHRAVQQRQPALEEDYDTTTLIGDEIRERN